MGGLGSFVEPLQWFSIQTQRPNLFLTSIQIWLSDVKFPHSFLLIELWGPGVWPRQRTHSLSEIPKLGPHRKNYAHTHTHTLFQDVGKTMDQTYKYVWPLNMNCENQFVRLFPQRNYPGVGRVSHYNIWMKCERAHTHTHKWLFSLCLSLILLVKINTLLRSRASAPEAPSILSRPSRASFSPHNLNYSLRVWFCLSSEIIIEIKPQVMFAKPARGGL